MWKILKAEFIDSKFILIIPYFIVLWPIVINVNKGWPTAEYDLRAIKSMMGAGIIFIFFSRLLIDFKEKKDRLHILLPLSICQIAITRLLFVFTVWVSFLLLYWIGSSSIRPYLVDKIILETLSLSGFVLLANAIIFIHRDFGFILSTKYQKIGLMGSYFLFIMLGYILFYFIFAVSIPYFKFLKQIDPFKENFKHIASSPYTAFLFNLLGIGFTGMSVVLFGRRNSYLE